MENGGWLWMFVSDMPPAADASQVGFAERKQAWFNLTPGLQCRGDRLVRSSWQFYWGFLFYRYRQNFASLFVQKAA